MSGGANSMGVLEALDLLGASALADPARLRRSFNTAVKAAHPDRAGGDDERLRRVIEAYRILQARPAAAVEAAAAMRLEISPREALAGGLRTVRLPGGRDVSLRLPAGMREGERLRAAGEAVVIAVLGDARACVIGDHLCVTARVERGWLRAGGRMILDAPVGPPELWVSRQDAARGLVRLAGQGLPARGRRPLGDLFVRLQPLVESGAETPAEAKLRRFAAAWAA
jgi:curved DNA-binding protein